MHKKNVLTGADVPLSSEITDRYLLENRRLWLQRAASGVAGLAAASWASRQALAQTPAGTEKPGKLPRLANVPSKVPGALVLEKPTAYKDASGYNNFYEFGTDKADPAANAQTSLALGGTLEE